MALNSRYIIDFPQIHKADEELVGKKAHALGNLWKLGIPFPSGFVITTEFYQDFLHVTGIDKEIKKAQALLHPALAGLAEKLFRPIQTQIMESRIPQELSMELHKHYRKFFGLFTEKPFNISSVYLNDKVIKFKNASGDANLLLKIRQIWSLSPGEPVAIIIQENIKSEIKGQVVSNDPAFDKQLTKPQRDNLLNYCSTIQKFFYFPKEIDYAICKGKIYILNIRPFTGRIIQSSSKALNVKTRKILANGIPLNPGIATGPVRILRQDFVKAKQGEIIVMSKCDKSSFEYIKNAKAVIVDSILPNSLDKIIYKKNFQIPTIEGVKTATRILHNGNIVTVNGASGDIYSGGLIY